mmetsp:Transcript_48740/g.56021  ORF Transcript_48740/g.56021 Transcript_48740/m.56021 type:complete len:135 (+) Transcript_48740:162-566(+)|eukprot:CAMPEP_0115005576 /NCGR_PEP_ID=MMETSP0216-20121206/19963_1 /TAXON_ID=223996 /ORGANISM="Protocruzia adherens, Strain Boccale" /LENGTH=134 /DNA_ID=CAMNT_0002371947 /DNA_START=116 /DNA_END=520 /DNA_ORIENTATION=-
MQVSKIQTQLKHFKILLRGYARAIKEFVIPPRRAEKKKRMSQAQDFFFFIAFSFAMTYYGEFFARKLGLMWRRTDPLMGMPFMPPNMGTALEHTGEDLDEELSMQFEMAQHTKKDWISQFYHLSKEGAESKPKK